MAFEHRAGLVGELGGDCEHCESGDRIDGCFADQWGDACRGLRVDRGWWQHEVDAEGGPLLLPDACGHGGGPCPFGRVVNHVEVSCADLEVEEVSEIQGGVGLQGCKGDGVFCGLIEVGDVDVVGGAGDAREGLKG